MSRVCCCMLPTINPNACLYCSNNQQYNNAQDYTRPFSVPSTTTPVRKTTIIIEEYVQKTPAFAPVLNSGNADRWSFAATT